jgi:hypothetical protein
LKRCSKCGHDKPATTSYFHKETGGLKAACKECRNPTEKRRMAGERGRYMPPPIEAVPEGFEVAKVSTEMNADGTLEKQHIGARPERTAVAPIMDAVQPGTTLKRLSTLTDSDGKVIQQWQIFTAEAEERAKRERWLLEAIERAAEKWPAREPVKLEGRTDDRLMCAIPMGDPHFGQYSWAAETGDDYDLELAAQYHCTAIDSLVSSAPPASRGLLIDLGDFFHMDNSSNQTLRGHHQLDVDSRWPKVIHAGVQSKIWLARRMLEKFGMLDVWCVPGNHDPHSAFMLQLALRLYFKDEPRVRVADVAGLFYLHAVRRQLDRLHAHAHDQGSSDARRDDGG